MKFLITGVAGFIGSNLVDLILEKTNHHIVVYDNLSAGKRSYLPQESERLTFIEGDILNQQQA